MAVKWSWAFGPETNTELMEMGWTMAYPSTSEITQSSAHTYTYPGAPVGRKSINMRRQMSVISPQKTSAAEGWACVAFYCSDVFDQWGENYHAIKIISGAGGKSIKIYSDASAPNQTMILQVDGAFDPSGSVTVTQNDWHYIALQYSMTGTIWSARWYLDGAPVGSLTTDGSAHATTDDQISLSIAGTSWSNSFYTWYGQIITYDDWSDDGGKPLYVTRVDPKNQWAGGAPHGQIGTWAPVGAATNPAAVESPYNTSSYSENTASVAGDRLVIYNFPDIATALNIDSSSIVYGVTNHAWVTGSGLSGSVGIAAPNIAGGWTTGSSILPDTNDPTYGYVSSGSILAADQLYMSYEVK